MLFVFVTIAVFQFFRLRNLPDPTGADGFFYLKQILSLSHGEGFYYKDYSFAFAAPSLLNIVLKDPLLTYQIWTSAMLGLIGWTAARLSFALVGERPLIRRERIAVTAIIAVMSLNVISQDMNLVFLKTATAGLFLLLSLERATRERWIVCAIFALLAIASHKVMIAIIPFYIAAYFITRRKRSTIIAVIAATAVAVIGVVIVRTNLYSHFQALLSQQDYGKWSTGSFQEFIFESWTMVGLVALAIFAWWIAKAQTAKWFYFATAIIFTFPALVPGFLRLQDPAYRMMMVAWILAAPMISQALLSYVKWQRWTAAAFAFLIIVSSIVHQPSTTRWAIPWSSRLPNPEELTKRVPADALVYAPHGVEFYLAYETPFRPRSFLIDPKGRELYRVAYIGVFADEPGALKDDIDQMTIAKLGQSFRVFREDDWLAINRIHKLPPLSLNVLERKPDFVADY